MRFDFFILQEYSRDHQERLWVFALYHRGKPVSRAFEHTALIRISKSAFLKVHFSL